MRKGLGRPQVTYTWANGFANETGGMGETRRGTGDVRLYLCLVSETRWNAGDGHRMAQPSDTGWSAILLSAPRNGSDRQHAVERVVERQTAKFSAISAIGAIRRAVCAGHAIDAREQAPRNAPLAGCRLAVAPSFWPHTGAPRRCQSSLGYELYDAHLWRLAWSLIAALTSADGRRAFIPGPLRLSRLNSSRRVSCINPCTNLVADLCVSALSSGRAWCGSGGNREQRD